MLGGFSSLLGRELGYETLAGHKSVVRGQMSVVGKKTILSDYRLPTTDY